jgi:hypothetical protein
VARDTQSSPIVRLCTPARDGGARPFRDLGRRPADKARRPHLSRVALELVKKSGVGSIRAAEFSLAPPAEKVGVGALHKSPQLGDPSLPLTRNPRADAQISDLSR